MNGDDKISPVNVVHLHYWPEQRAASFERVVRDAIVSLIQNFALRGPWTVRANIEMTHGIKLLHTPMGTVRVESVITDDREGLRVFEVRGEK